MDIQKNNSFLLLSSSAYHSSAPTCEWAFNRSEDNQSNTCLCNVKRCGVNIV